MKESKIPEIAYNCILQTYARYPVAVKAAEGSIIKDHGGKEYLDFTSGIGVLNLGHNHPSIIKAIYNQLNKHLHLSNFFYSDSQTLLAKELCEIFPSYKVFFSNSGAESVEAGIKFARRYGIRKKGEGVWNIISMRDSFHGRTLGALSLTWSKKYRKDFGPLLRGVSFVPFGDLNALRKKISPNTCAIIIEAIQIEGAGIRFASREFYEGLQRICAQRDIILIVDEIQTGLGRTGKLFAFEHYSLKPDIVLLAKALGGGLPLGAVMVGSKVQKYIEVSDHASTFGGNPLACAAGLAVLGRVKNRKFLKEVEEKGKYFFQRLSSLKEKYPAIIDEIRGIGLLWGVDLKEAGDSQRVIDKCREKGLLLLKAGAGTIRFLPPLTVKRKEIEGALKIFEGVIKG